MALARAQSVEISRVLHAGYIFEADSTKIIFDPIFENPFSQNCYAFPSVKFDREAISGINFSAVFISHYHDDHCSFESLHLLGREIPIYIFCIHEELIGLIRALGFKTVIPLQIDVPVSIGPLKVTARKALDADVDSIFQIQFGKLNILNVVDSWIDDDTLQQLLNEGHWDLVLWPFQTMQEIEVLSPALKMKNESTEPEIPPEWTEQLKKLRPRFLIPSSCQFIHESWSWYNQSFFPISYRNFTQHMEKVLPETKIFKLDPGQSFRLTEKNIQWLTNLPWIIPVGSQNVDYLYKPDQPRPTTAEIAQMLPELSEAEMNGVLQFCKHGLPLKFAELEWPESKYFLQKYIWKLSVYGQNKCFTFCYQIKKDQIQLLENEAHEISWLTEVPAVKIFSVLKNGESLSSMYLRINDFHFSAEHEKIIAEVDILEDPLIRVLFTGNFASYQKAQLEKINAKNKREL